MKNILLVTSAVLVALFGGCEQPYDPNTELGDIEAYFAEEVAVSASSFGIATTTTVVKRPMYLYVQQLEVSEDGVTWHEISDGEKAKGLMKKVSVKNDETKVNPGWLKKRQGMVNAVRIRIAPKFRQDEAYSDGTFQLQQVIERLPDKISKRTLSGVKDITVSDTITFSSADGSMTPFEIPKNGKVYVVVDFDVNNFSGSPSYPEEYYAVTMTVWGTTILDTSVEEEASEIDEDDN